MSTWYQQALTPPDVYEATLKVGVIPSSDHTQVWWEVKDPTTGVLIAQQAVHHATLQDLPHRVVDAVREMLGAIDEIAPPF